MNSDPSPNQILTTITTHILERAIMLFAPISLGTEGLDGELLSFWYSADVWAEIKRNKLREWMKHRASFKGESEARYLLERTKLLNDLQESGRDTQTNLNALEQSLQCTDKAIAAAEKEGILINVRSYRSHVHVAETVMDRLDELYCDTFRGEKGRLTLLDCFSIQKDDAKTVMFMEYLGAVQTLLESLCEAPALISSGGDSDPQMYGLANARVRLYFYFKPVDGRICLPIPTVSMLSDLRSGVLMDQRIVSLVRKSSPHCNGGIITPRCHRLDDGWKDLANT